MNKKVVLVLSGGNALGLAHVGVITMLERFKIPIHAVVGCSMGALVGGLYCAGKIKDFRKELLTKNRKEIYRLFIAKPSALGMVHHGKIEQFLNQFVRNVKIEELNKKYVCIALDLVSGEKVILSKGNLTKAILASTSIPGVFVPVMKGQKVMVDAGYFDPLPIDVAKEVFPDYFILAVDVGKRKKEVVEAGRIPNIVNTFRRLIQISENLWTKNLGVGADILLKPNVKIKPFQYHLAEKAIMDGEEEALLNIPKIRKELGLS
jgi:NTE family protein